MCPSVLDQRFGSGTGRVDRDTFEHLIGRYMASFKTFVQMGFMSWPCLMGVMPHKKGNIRLLEPTVAKGWQGESVQTG